MAQAPVNLTMDEHLFMGNPPIDARRLTESPATRPIIAHLDAPVVPWVGFEEAAGGHIVEGDPDA